MLWSAIKSMMSQLLICPWREPGDVVLALESCLRRNPIPIRAGPACQPVGLGPGTGDWGVAAAWRLARYGTVRFGTGHGSVKSAKLEHWNPSREEEGRRKKETWLHLSVSFSACVWTGLEFARGRARSDSGVRRGLSSYRSTEYNQGASAPLRRIAIHSMFLRGTANR